MKASVLEHIIQPNDNEEQIRYKLYLNESRRSGSGWLPSPAEVDAVRDQIREQWDERERNQRIADDRFKFARVEVHHDTSGARGYRKSAMGSSHS